MNMWKAGTGCMALLALALLAAPPTALAEAYFNLKAGAYMPSGKSSYSAGMDVDTSSRLSNMGMTSNFNGELEFGYDFLPGPNILAVDVSLGYFKATTGVTTSELGTASNISGALDVVPVSLGLTGGKQYGPVRVYAGAGLDLLFCNLDFDMGLKSGDGSIGMNFGSDSETVFGGHLKAGFSYDLTDHLYVGAEAKYLMVGNADFRLKSASLNGNVNGSAISIPPTGGNFGNVSADLSGFLVTALVGFRF